MSEKLMIVDDNHSILDTVSYILEDSGFEIITASSGKECIDHVSQGFKGVILLDVMMPGLTGWETIAELIKKNTIKNVIICMLTCVVDPDEEALKVSQYVTGYLKKPFEIEDLVSAVKHYTSLRSEINEK